MSSRSYFQHQSSSWDGRNSLWVVEIYWHRRKFTLTLLLVEELDHLPAVLTDPTQSCILLNCLTKQGRCLRDKRRWLCLLISVSFCSYFKFRSFFKSFWLVLDRSCCLWQLIFLGLFVTMRLKSCSFLFRITPRILYSAYLIKLRRGLLKLRLWN